MGVDTPSRGAVMAREILEQPDRLASLLTSGSGAIREANRRIRSYGPRVALFAGRGTSDHAALYAKYLVEVFWGLPCGLVSPSTTTVYHASPDLSGTLFVAVSQSGASPDLVESLSAARSHGALTVAVTNDPASELAEAAELCVDVAAGPERAVAATKTYTAELLALYLLLAPSVHAEAGRLPDAAARTLDHGVEVAGAVERLRQASRLIVTARGFSYPTAREAALKIIETSYLPALAFSAADLLHGPMALLDTGTPVLAVDPGGAASGALTAVLERLDEREVSPIVVGPGAEVPVELEGIPEELSPILTIMPLQQVALELAMTRGNDPDAPRGLSKVTRTR